MYSAFSNIRFMNMIKSSVQKGKHLNVRGSFRDTGSLLSGKIRRGFMKKTALISFWEG